MSFRLLIDNIYDAYKKLKAHVYYDKNSLFLRKQIAEFESSDAFEKKLQDLCVAINENDGCYFNKLYNQINYKILPKKFKLEDYENNSLIITNRYLLIDMKVIIILF